MEKMSSQHYVYALIVVSSLFLLSACDFSGDALIGNKDRDYNPYSSDPSSSQQATPIPNNFYDAESYCDDGYSMPGHSIRDFGNYGRATASALSERIQSSIHRLNVHDEKLLGWPLLQSEEDVYSPPSPHASKIQVEEIQLRNATGVLTFKNCMVRSIPSNSLDFQKGVYCEGEKSQRLSKGVGNSDEYAIAKLRATMFVEQSGKNEYMASATFTWTPCLAQNASWRMSNKGRPIPSFKLMPEVTP